MIIKYQIIVIIEQDYISIKSYYYILNNNNNLIKVIIYKFRKI